NAVEERRTQRTAERYRTAVEALGYPVYVVDETGEFRFVNEAFADLTGYSVEEIVGSTPDLIKGESAVETAENQLGDILSSDGPEVARFEVDIEPADGDPVPCRDHMAVLPYEGEEFRGSVGILRNLSEEERRKRELARYERIVEAAGDAVYGLDAGGHIQFVNDRFTEMTGYPEAELVGEHISVVLDDDDVEEGRRVIRELVDGDEDSTKMEMGLVTADGERIPVENSVALLDDPDGDGIRGTTGIIRDISDRRERERELALKERAMDEAPVGITIAEAGGDMPMTYVNDSFVGMTGYSESEAVGANCRFLQGEGTDPETVDRMREAIEAEEPVSVRVLNYRKDGERFWNRVSIAPIERDGEVTHYAGFQDDITDSVSREHELQRQNERLERFASVVSHDLRNPLNVAQGRLDLLRGECDSEHVAAIADSLDRIDTLVDDLLTLAHQGQTVDDVEAVRLADAVESCWTNVRTGEATVEVEADATVRADRSRLGQVFENLFRNAVEHGGADVTVTVGALDDGFYVEDDGPGIPAEERDRVFEAGYSTADEGTGFGLNIVSEVVEAHGWTIEATEGTDGGARFEITGVSVE
ncbi:MAG: PAS domain S-box protein, partial [Halobacteriaceae archaeon]